MKNLKKHGKYPFHIAVIHGGPGAGGETAPIAREISSIYGVLEPIQTEISIKGQIEELRDILIKHGDIPVILAGHSWGAWLTFIFSAEYPELVEKLILIGTPPFEENYTAEIQEIRMKRLSIGERKKVKFIINLLKNESTKNKSLAFKQLGKLFSKADAFDPLFNEFDSMEFNIEIFENVWKEAEKLRKNGKLLEIRERIKCPVVAVHGDYDPHPAQGVYKPLSSIIKDFKFILLKNCGHKPWIEKNAKEKFYRILMEECKSVL